ncbi:DUF2336 domain-containing protein [Roseiarcus fermentans]|uniref:DUF2336 domain-containing protein n=1 Tax=Roseiarcus fermentans TaxID=1473586 RepID=UPI0014760C93|nr:DUF2336 domain-containing protein [Roseiarcus fermentans]
MRRVSEWAQRAGTRERAEAASALARAFLDADMTSALRADCAAALAALAADRAAEVRRALAEAFAGARRAPRALVVALARDRSEVALPLLARSPLLADADLVDCVALGDAAAQCAVARRPGLGAGPAAALAEVGARESALALLDNRGAAIAPASLLRLIDRFAADAGIREALGVRPDLPACVEAAIAIAADRPAASRAARRARDVALTGLAARCPENELPALVRTIGQRGALTLALLLRSLLGGERRLFVAALAELAGLDPARAAKLVSDPRGKSFAAAAAKAGLPAPALPVLRAALASPAAPATAARAPLPAAPVVAAIAACEAENDPTLAPFIFYLRRLAEEADADAPRRPPAALPQRTLPKKLEFPPANDAPVAPTSALSDRADPAPPLALPAHLVLALDAA